MKKTVLFLALAPSAFADTADVLQSATGIIDILIFALTILLIYYIIKLPFSLEETPHSPRGPFGHHQRRGFHLPFKERFHNHVGDFLGSIDEKLGRKYLESLPDIYAWSPGLAQEIQYNLESLKRKLTSLNNNTLKKLIEGTPAQSPFKDIETKLEREKIVLGLNNWNECKTNSKFVASFIEQITNSIVIAKANSSFDEEFINEINQIFDRLTRYKNDVEYFKEKIASERGNTTEQTTVLENIKKTLGFKQEIMKNLISTTEKLDKAPKEVVNKARQSSTVVNQISDIRVFVISQMINRFQNTTTNLEDIISNLP